MRNTLHPDRAFVHVDELTRQVQADPRPRHIVLVTGKETVKDGSNIFRRNAFAIIFDRKLDLISFILQADRDRTSVQRELECVGQKIGQNLLHLIPVYPYINRRAVMLKREMYLLGGSHRIEIRFHFCHKSN